MKKLALMMIAVFSLYLSNVFAQPVFTQIYFFGDSVTDIGNESRTPITNPPGITWVYTVTDHYSLDVSPSGHNDDQGGNNWAHALEKTNTLIKRINNFVSVYPTLSPDDLIIIWVGFNDYISRFANQWPNSTPIATVIDDAIANYQTVLSTLQAHGAQNILMIALPRVDLMPAGTVLANQYGTQIIPALQDATAQYNQAMQDMIADYTDVFYFDVNPIFLEVLADYQSYGFKDVTNIYTGCPADCNPDEYFFWDFYHPTNAGHKIIGQGIYEFIDANL